MAEIYSRRLGDGNESGAGSGLAYTTPSGVVAVVRCLTVVLFPGTTFGGVYRTDSVAYIGGATATGALYPETINMRHVLEAGETLTWQFQGGGGTWILSGYELVI